MRGHAIRYDPSLPRGFAKSELRRARSRFNMTGKVDIHHIIPREFKSHVVIKRESYHIEDPYNLIFLPTVENDDIQTHRPLHRQRHGMYNEFVRRELDRCTTHSSFIVLLLLLHRICRGQARVF